MLEPEQVLGVGLHLLVFALTFALSRISRPPSRLELKDKSSFVLPRQIVQGYHPVKALFGRGVVIFWPAEGSRFNRGSLNTAGYLYHHRAFARKSSLTGEVFRWIEHELEASLFFSREGETLEDLEVSSLDGCVHIIYSDRPISFLRDETRRRRTVSFNGKELVQYWEGERDGPFILSEDQWIRGHYSKKNASVGLRPDEVELVLWPVHAEGVGVPRRAVVVKDTQLSRVVEFLSVELGKIIFISRWGEEVSLGALALDRQVNIFFGDEPFEVLPRNIFLTDRVPFRSSRHVYLLSEEEILGGFTGQLFRLDQASTLTVVVWILPEKCEPAAVIGCEDSARITNIDEVVKSKTSGVRLFRSRSVGLQTLVKHLKKDDFDQVHLIYSVDRPITVNSNSPKHFELAYHR